ncbi:DUF5615 family PIN-like protein [Nostoc sp.]|uniref:DUF5615 family PIN-like protein n=1 Tax=Nostoc sp. TaxID=1180 RepID=UPI002FFD2F80
MKLLFDENLSPKLSTRLSNLFPDSLHVRDVGMKATIDPIVWNYAKDNDLMIVSKDADMHDLSLVFGNPPKVIWLRLGNRYISLTHPTRSAIAAIAVKEV